MTVWPTSGPRMTLPFASEQAPFYSATNKHKGTDLAPRPPAEGGSLHYPVYAWLAGVVAGTGRHSTAGNYVITRSVLHAEGSAPDLDGVMRILPEGAKLETHYYHLQNITAQMDARVQAGEPIGTIGSTGKSSGPHLHWEVRVMGTHERDVIDPVALYWSLKKAEAVPAEKYSIFQYETDGDGVLIRITADKKVHVRRD